PTPPTARPSAPRQAPCLGRFRTWPSQRIDPRSVGVTSAATSDPLSVHTRIEKASPLRRLRDPLESIDDRSSRARLCLSALGEMCPWDRHKKAICRCHLRTEPQSKSVSQTPSNLAFF